MESEHDGNPGNPMKQAYLMVIYIFFQVAECAKLEDSLIDAKGKLEMSDLRIQQVLSKEVTTTSESW